MAKLYHEGDQWVVPGTQGRAAVRADVPNSPDALAAWLNDRGVPVAPGAEPKPTGLAVAGDHCEPVPADRNLSADTITEWLLGAATQAQVEAVFAAIGARWGEARR